MQDDFVMTPGEVQRSLEVSASGLRRLAAAYEDVHGDLQKDTHGGRIFSGAAVERLRKARALYDEGRARSVKDGLQLVASGVEASPAAPAKLRDDAVLEVVLARLEALQNEVRSLRGDLQEARALPSVTASEAGATGEIEGGARGEDGVLVRFARRLERLLGRQNK